MKEMIGEYGQTMVVALIVWGLIRVFAALMVMVL